MNIAWIITTYLLLLLFISCICTYCIISIIRYIRKRKTKGQIQQWDVVIPKPESQVQLHCGTGMYKMATVVSADPFILVSLEGDMRWNNHKKDNFLTLRRANTTEIINADRRKHK
jgi:hypothetical protein